MRVLELFCGVGGSGHGYAEVGAEVVGVDVNPQPDYLYDFIQADALEATRFTFQGFDLIHASPPCQFGAAISKGTNQRLRSSYPNLYPATKAMLERSGVPYVIENPDARADMVLCGEMFGLRVQRHRRFELGNWSAKAPAHVPHKGLTLGMRHGKLVTEENGGYYYAVYGNGGYKGTVAQWQDAMGIHWTENRKSIAEAIPPAYTEYIGGQFRLAMGEVW